MGGGTASTLTIGTSGILMDSNSSADPGNATIGSTVGTNAVNIDLNGSQNWDVATEAGSPNLFIVNNVTNASTTSPVTLTINSFGSGSGLTTTNNVIIGGIISDGGVSAQTSLTVAMASQGSVVLTGANTYTGNTSIYAGNLFLDFASSDYTGTAIAGDTVPTNNIVSSSSAPLWAAVLAGAIQQCGKPPGILRRPRVEH